MLTIPKPQSKADLDPNFEKRFRDLKTHAAAAAVAGGTGGQVLWFRPAGWNGDPADIEGLSVPFSREKANEAAVAAVKDVSAPGTTADTAVTTLMIDTLACMERAFRVRHTLRRPRAMAQAIGRQRGHGSDTGPLVQCGIEFARGIVNQGKS